MKAIFSKIRQNICTLMLFTGIAAFYFTHGCPIRFFTGIACPGCGMSRALSALLRFDFSLAFEMHPLVYLLPAAVLVYFFRRLIPRKMLQLICVFALVMLLAVYIIRLTGQSAVVYADFESGLLFRLSDKLNII